MSSQVSPTPCTLAYCIYGFDNILGEPGTCYIRPSIADVLLANQTPMPQNLCLDFATLGLGVVERPGVYHCSSRVPENQSDDKGPTRSFRVVAISALCATTDDG